MIKKSEKSLWESNSFIKLLKKNKVKRIALFGSRATNRVRKTSDYDFLVEFEKGADLLDQVGLKLDLEQYLKSKVDIVTEKSLSPYIKRRVLNEAVYLNE